MKQQELTSSEIKEIFGYIIENNKRLVAEGKNSISIALEGESGVGKTSVLKQLAAEKDMDFLKLNLSQISIEDFIGFPISEYKMCAPSNKEEECLWVSERTIPTYTELGYTYAGENRMGYATPKWIIGKDKPMILLLDDFNRGSLGMLQASMEIVDNQEYISWRLPKGSTVILSNNPDNGEYFVSSQDSAHQTRYLNFHMKFDTDTWAEWSEANGIDGRCINFILKNPEVVTSSKDFDEKGSKLKKANIRLWTKFFDTISGIENFETQLGKVMLIGGSSIPQEHMLLFSQFVQNKLDKLLSPQMMLDGDEKKVLKELKSIIGTGNARRNDLASILSKRLMNYCAANEKDLTKDQVERFAIILESEVFTKDIVHLVARKIVSIQKLKQLIHRPKMVEYYS